MLVLIPSVLPHCRVLRLSRPLLDQIRDWCAGSEDASEEEKGLARQLHDDFSRFPPAEEAAAGAQAAAAGGADAVLDTSGMTFDEVNANERMPFGFG